MQNPANVPELSQKLFIFFITLFFGRNVVDYSLLQNAQWMLCSLRSLARNCRACPAVYLVVYIDKYTYCTSGRCRWMEKFRSSQLCYMWSTCRLDRWTVADDNDSVSKTRVLAIKVVVWRNEKYFHWSAVYYQWVLCGNINFVYSWGKRCYFTLMQYKSNEEQLDDRYRTVKVLNQRFFSAILLQLIISKGEKGEGKEEKGEGTGEKVRGRDFCMRACLCVSA